jgi:hypothetical protein
MDDEYGSAGIDIKRLVSDIKKWKNDIKAATCMIEGALITLDAYLDEVKK